MAKEHEIEVVMAEYRHKSAELAAMIEVKLRTILLDHTDIEPGNWVAMKDAMFQLKRTRKVIQNAARRIGPTAGVKDTSGRILINLDTIGIGPPRGRSKENCGILVEGKSG